MDKKIKKLLEENIKLKKEIEILNSKLALVKVWMEKEIKAQAHKIAQRKIKNFSSWVRNDFLNENFEEMIANKINSYFWDLLLLNAPKWTIEAITAWEINFFNMLKNDNIDWLAVISSYHKALDLFIEAFITNNFRKFAKKRWCIFLRVNDHLEKSLNSIVNQKYILSVWRLYGLIKKIKDWEILYDYSKCFKEYLEKYENLQKLLLNDKIFFKLFTEINKMEVLASKRHSWIINKKETIKARKILIWNLEDKNSLIYKLLETQVSFY